MAIEKPMPVLPVEAYTSQKWFEREQQCIFSRTWQFAGFVEDLSVIISIFMSRWRRITGMA